MSGLRCLVRQNRFRLLGCLSSGRVLGILGSLGLVGGRLGESRTTAVPYTVARRSVTSAEASSTVAAAVTSTVNASFCLFLKW